MVDIVQGQDATIQSLTPARPQVDAAPASPAERSRAGKIASRIVLAAAIVCIAVAAALLGFRETYEEKIYPGVYVAGVPVAGMTEAEARAAIEAKAAEFEGARAYFDALDRHWAPTLGELGVTVNIEESVRQAMEVGRETGGKERVSAMLGSLREETWLPLSVEMSRSALESWALGISEELGIVPHNAELTIENGKVSVVAEANGTVVDIDELQTILLSSVEDLKAPTSQLPLVDKQPSVFAKDLEPARQQIEAALSAGITLRFDGSTWDIDPATFGDFIGIAIDPDVSGAESVSVEVDQRELARWLGELIGPTVNKDPKNAKVAWDGKKLKQTVPGSDGIRLLPSSLAEQATASFFNGHENVEVPVQVLKPEVNGGNLDQLGITTKLASGSSNFDGSDDSRATNIQVGVDLLNGTLIPPGGEFSFNRSIGVITTDLGFVESQVIDGERIGRDIGGGICQVSTTVFRAALYAGMPISEWHPHRYRLGFYELDGWTPGIDASILQPEGDPFGGGDFKFVNPTESWLLVESYVEWPRAYVVIYGPDLGYTVEVSEPVLGEEFPPTADLELLDEKLPAGSVVQSEWAIKGMEVTYYRTVYGSDGATVLNDSFYTYFAPRGNVFKVSPDMQGYSPAG